MTKPIARLTADFKPAQRRIGTTQGRLADQTDLMRDFLMLGFRTVRVNFESEGRPRWDDLAPSTIRQRFPRHARSRGGRAMGSLAALGSIRILFNTGHLAQSMGYDASGPFNAQGGHGEIDERSMSIGTSNPGAWNQFRNTRTGAPARRFAMWQQQDRADIIDMARDWYMARGPYALS